MGKTEVNTGWIQEINMNENITDGITDDDERREIIILKYGQAIELGEMLSQFEDYKKDPTLINKIYSEIDALEAKHAKQLKDLKKRLGLTH